MKVVREIFGRKIYDKGGNFIQQGETWLDIGANIGAFSLYCQLKGAHIIAYEPDERNFQRLSRLGVEAHQVAVSNYNGTAKFYLENNPSNHWRHTLYPVKGRRSVQVDVIDAKDLPKCDGMKIDAEGSEVDIIYRLNEFPSKLVFEYDGGRHPLKADYDHLIDFLKTKYSNVTYPSVLKERIDFWPNGLLVCCSNLTF